MSDTKRFERQRRINAGEPAWMVDQAAAPVDSQPAQPSYSPPAAPFAQNLMPQAAARPDVFNRRSEHEGAFSSAQVQPLPANFMPSPEYIEWMIEHCGIPAQFSLSQVADFKLYWLETGEARKAWQNKFKTHVIYQWKRQQRETEQNPNRSTVERLTDTSWADHLDI